MEICINCGGEVVHDKDERVWTHNASGSTRCYDVWAPKPYSMYLAEPDLNDDARREAENGD